MQMNMLVVLLLSLLPFLAESSSIIPKESTVDGKKCDQMLETFWKLNDENVEEEYRLIITEKLNSKPEALNQILSEREQFVEYERKSKQSMLRCMI